MCWPLVNVNVSFFSWFLSHSSCEALIGLLHFTMARLSLTLMRVLLQNLSIEAIFETHLCTFKELRGRSQSSFINECFLLNSTWWSWSRKGSLSKDIPCFWLSHCNVPILKKKRLTSICYMLCAYFLFSQPSVINDACNESLRAIFWTYTYYLCFNLCFQK